MFKIIKKSEYYNLVEMYKNQCSACYDKEEDKRKLRKKIRELESEIRRLKDECSKFGRKDNKQARVKNDNK